MVTDEARPEADPQEVHDLLLELSQAIEDHFGGDEPDDAALRVFLVQHLMFLGRTRAEAEAFVADLD